MLAQAMRAGFPVVAFNAAYDLSILETELGRHGLASLASRLDTADVRPVVDPLVLDRHLDRYRKGKRKLIDMCATYGVPVDEEGLHAADADVIATLDVVQAMARAYPAMGDVALRDLHDQQISAHRVWAENFRAWLASKGKTDDLPSLEWPISAA
jgi:DNA polymerase-3 subunit epsilon